MPRPQKILASILFSLLCFCSNGYAIDQCAAFFGIEPYQANQSYGRQIFSRELKAVEDFASQYQDLSFAELVNAILASDLRKQFFQLRILSQTYEAFDAHFFSDQVKRFKDFEFLIGRIDLYTKLADHPVAKEEPEVAAYFLQEKVRVTELFRDSLKKIGTVHNPQKAFQKIAKEFEEYPSWPNAQRDSRFLVDEAISFASNLNIEIQNKKYDSEDLEKGLHKLRRRLRELTIRIKNWDGLVQLVDEGPLNSELRSWYLELQKKYPEMTGSPYLPRGTPEIAKPILVAAKLESMITAIVGEIGSSKDQIEPLNYLNEVLESGRLSPEVQKRVAAKLQDLKSQASDELKLVHDLQSRITATQLLEEIVRFLKMFNQTSAGDMPHR